MMAIVTCGGNSFACNKAIKGPDYLHLLDESGSLIVAFDGVSDFSGFAISDGDWASPASTEENSVAVRREDGTTGSCGVPLSRFHRSDTPTILTNNVQYGTALPESGVEGQLFFLIV